jgi:hypothetical protein
MEGLLNELLVAGLIENLDGDDGRFDKMVAASNVVAEELKEDPKKLIGSVLAGLDPDISVDDPAIALTQRTLTAEWKSINSVYPSPPIGLFRAILLDACQQASSEGKNAAILWLTAADTVPFMKLGQEEAIIRKVLKGFAKDTEAIALTVPKLPVSKKLTDVKMPETEAIQAPAIPKVNRGNLENRIGAAAGPQYPQGTKQPDCNPHWSNNASHWSWEFAPRMSALMSDELDKLAASLVKTHSANTQRINTAQVEFAESMKKTLTAQRRWVNDALKANERRSQVEQIRLNSLWWSEALYSPLLDCSYRELDAALAATLMPLDLLGDILMPAPASVGYLLVETTRRLDEEKVAQQQPLIDVLKSLRGSIGTFSDAVSADLEAPVVDGRLSLRDLVVIALDEKGLDLADAVGRSGLKQDTKITLSTLAKAIFRQEQAVRLAGDSQ